MNNEMLKDEQIEDLRKAFASMDTDGDGTLSAAELYAALRQGGIHINTEELNGLMSELDLDKDGRVDFAEFINIASKSHKDIDTEEEMREIFMVFDKERTGFISMAQVKYVMKCLGENLTDDEIHEVFDIGDADQDGKLNFEEFLSIMNAKDQQAK